MRFSLSGLCVGPGISRSLLVLVLAGIGSAAVAEGPGYPGIYFAADVENQFRFIARRGDGLAFGIGPVETGGPSDPSLCKHMQGLARLPGTGTPYLFVSRSGNDPGFTCFTGFEEDSPGNLYVVRLESRDMTGERLRSNRLWRDWVPYIDTPVGQIPFSKSPDPRDKIVRDIPLAGIWPSYMHPGGMQIVDNVLLVALEAPFDGPSPPSPDHSVLLVDVSDPEVPAPLSLFPPTGSTIDFGPSGLAGFTPVRNPEGEGLRYLMITSGGPDDHVGFWRSLSTTGSPNGPSDLRAPDLAWEPMGRWSPNHLDNDNCSNGESWQTGRAAHQFLNFVREDNLDGSLYLVAGRNSGIGGDGDDFITLYRVNVNVYGDFTAECPINLVDTRHVSSYPFGGHGDSAALSAAGGAYVSPAGELIVYGTEYENDGPFEYGSATLKRTVRFVEWRNINVVRADSPTLKPSVVTARQITVDEGSDRPVTAVGRGPITRAWIQLFEDDGAGASLPAVGNDDWLQVDYDDWSMDHFDDFGRLDETTGTNYNDNAGSWRWFAPQGCTLRANEDPVGASTGVFPGTHTRTLIGDGDVHPAPDLDEVRNDGGNVTIDDKISSVQFDAIEGYAWEHAECNAYYSAPIDVQWDLDFNGSFETEGMQVDFAAAALDGPSNVDIAVRGKHPTDTTSYGIGAALGISVTVRNVAPLVAAPDIVDSAGNAVGSGVPFVLVGLPLGLSASFSDPGLPDTQTASITWGDGVTVDDTSFAVFDDAFGDGSGFLNSQHVYSASGLYEVIVVVTDDDAGSGGNATPVRVVTPEEAVAEMVSMLEDLIAATTDDKARKALEKALKALAGSNANSANGALQKLASGQIAAAKAMLRQAQNWLADASGHGVPVGALLAILQQVLNAV